MLAKKKKKNKQSTKKRANKKSASVFGPSPVQDKLINGLEGMDSTEAEKVRKKMLLLDAELNFEKAKLIYNTLREQDFDYKTEEKNIDETKTVFSGEAEEEENIKRDASETEERPVKAMIQKVAQKVGREVVSKKEFEEDKSQQALSRSSVTEAKEDKQEPVASVREEGKIKKVKEERADTVKPASPFEKNFEERLLEKERIMKEQGALSDESKKRPRVVAPKYSRLEKIRQEIADENKNESQLETEDKSVALTKEEKLEKTEGERSFFSRLFGHKTKKDSSGESETREDLDFQHPEAKKQAEDKGVGKAKEEKEEQTGTEKRKTFSEKTKSTSRVVKSKKMKGIEVFEEPEKNEESVVDDKEGHKNKFTKKLAALFRPDPRPYVRRPSFDPIRDRNKTEKKEIILKDAKGHKVVGNEKDEVRSARDLIEKLSQLFHHVSQKEDKEEVLDLRDEHEVETEDLKEDNVTRMRAVDVPSDEIEKDEVLDLKEQVAGQKHVALDASESPSYQERGLDLRDTKTKKAERRKRRAGEKKPLVLAPFYRDQQSGKKPSSAKVVAEKKDKTGKTKHDKTEIQKREIDDLYRNIKFSSFPEGPNAYEFPKDFLWGTSTSAYQVEGSNMNDWSLWEKGGKRSLQLMKAGKTPEDYICGQACDSFNRYEEDFDLAASLNTNAVRFGLEWSRIQPRRRTWDMAAIDHYRQVLKSAKERGFKTVLTLWHWTNPLWFAKRGGWENEKNISHFKQYVKLCTEEFGSHVDYWITLNEPMVHVLNGYLVNKFPPGRRSPAAAKRAMKNLANAHIGAYNIIHRRFKNAQVSITKLYNYFEPASRYNLIERGMARSLDHFANKVILEKIKNHLDFIGFDYYFHDRVVWHPPFIKNKDSWVTDMDWEIYPEGIYHVLKKLSRFDKPIVVMENGLADAEDRLRGQFIKEHLYWTWKAIQEGVKVDGYFYWSLLDNFEWAEGFGPKFGLFEVDRETFARKKRASADVYAEIARSNTLVL